MVNHTFHGEAPSVWMGIRLTRKFRVGYFGFLKLKPEICFEKLIRTIRVPNISGSGIPEIPEKYNVSWLWIERLLQMDEYKPDDQHRVYLRERRAIEASADRRGGSRGGGASCWGSQESWPPPAAAVLLAVAKLPAQLPNMEHTHPQILSTALRRWPLRLWSGGSKLAEKSEMCWERERDEFLFAFWVLTGGGMRG
jgi:hypothetical protein